MSDVPTDEEIAIEVRRVVARAFTAPEDVAREVADSFEIDAERVLGFVAPALATRAHEMAQWPAETDCDRLDRMFVALEDGGVVARQNFTCCSTCGHDGILSLVHERLERGSAVDGYVFYHQQDTESGADGHGLSLRFSPLGGGRTEALALGRRIVEAARAAGLPVHWNEDPSRVIHLAPFDWKRRERPRTAAELAAESFDGAAALARWTRAFPGAVAADFVALASPRYGEVLVHAGQSDAALAWARAARGTREADALRAVALAHIGAALGRAAPSALWLEALGDAPWGHGSALVEVLMRAPLEDPAVHALARKRALFSRTDAWGAAARAWYLLRAGTMLPAEERADRLARLLELFGADGVDRRLVGARAAFAAGLMLLGVEHVASIVVAAAVDRALDPAERRIAIAALAEARKLAPHAAEIAREAPELGGAVSEALVGAGELDAAASLEAGPAAARLARLARHGIAREGRTARVDAWIAGANEATASFADDLASGLLSLEEVLESRLELASLGIALGRDVRSEIRTIAASLAAPFDLVDLRSHLAAVAAGTRGARPPIDPKWLDETQLAKARREWSAAGSNVMRGRRYAERILRGATALAATGELARAGALVAEADAHGELPVTVDEARACAYVAIGQLERAEELAARGMPGAEAAAAIAIAQLEDGRPADALATVRKALDDASRIELVALAPAILALAPDRPSAATAMFAATDRALALLRH